MSRNKFLVAGIVLAILAGIAITVLLAASMPTTEVVKLSKAVQPGDPLKGNIYVEKMPKRSIPSGAFRSTVEVEDKYSLATLFKGDILRTPHVAETIADGGTLGSRLRGMDMSDKLGIALDEEATAGLQLEVGDRVRICAVSEYYSNNAIAQTQEGAIIPPSSSEGEQPVIIIPDAKVISVPQIDAEGDSVGSVVVAVTQEEFLKLSQAKEIGSIHAAVLPIGQ